MRFDMCGIAGISFPATLTTRDREDLTSAFAFVAESMETRGRDSYAVATLFPDGGTTVHRGLGAISKGHGARFEDDASAILVHTRLATQGPKTLRNAHFWHHGSLILAHNGGVWGDGRTGLLDRYECDSEALAHHFGTMWGRTPAKAIGEDWTGYGSIHAIDAHKAGIVLSRMSGGDLQWARFIAPSGGVALVWASKFYPEVTLELQSLGFRLMRHKDPFEGVVYTVDRGRFQATDSLVKLRQSSFYASHSRLTRGESKRVPKHTESSLDWESWLSRAEREGKTEPETLLSGFELVSHEVLGDCWRDPTTGDVIVEETQERISARTWLEITGGER